MPMNTTEKRKKSSGPDEVSLLELKKRVGAPRLILGKENE